MALTIGGNAIPEGWPPGYSVNSVASGMDPEMSRIGAWINYQSAQKAKQNAAGSVTQAAAGIDPATGKALPSQGQGTNMPTGYTPGVGNQRFYDPAEGPKSTGGNTSLSDYLQSKLGPSQSYVRSITSLGGPGGAGSTQIVRGGGGAGDLTSIMKSISDAQARANAANESRYKEAGNLLTGYGKSYQGEINDAYKQDVGKTEQDAISRGIGNTTIRNSLLQGVANTRNKANLALQDRLAAQRVNLLQSKSDNAPDPMAFAQLLQNATQGAYGSGGTLSSIAAALGLLR